MVKVFLDTEFTGLHQRASLISMALYVDDDTYFYAEFNDYSVRQLTPWIQENVISKLQITQTFSFVTDGEKVRMKGNKTQIRKALRIWLIQFDLIEIWADVLAYDWVLFCNLFGGAFKIPENIFYAPFDISTLFRSKGLIMPNSKYGGDISRLTYVDVNGDGKQHNALEDARIGKLCYDKLMEK